MHNIFTCILDAHKMYILIVVMLDIFHGENTNEQTHVPHSGPTDMLFYGLRWPRESVCKISALPDTVQPHRQATPRYSGYVSRISLLT